MMPTGLLAFAVAASNTMFSAEARAHVCYQGQELHTDGDGNEAYKWVLTAQDPCECSDISRLFGGINTHPWALKGHDPSTGTLDNYQQHKCPLEPTTAVLAACNVVTISVGSHEKSSLLSITLNDMSVWELEFNVSPQGSATQITKEIIRFWQSGMAATPADYRIEFSPNAVEILKEGAQAKRVDLIYVNWSNKHSVALGGDQLIFDGTSYPTNLIVNFEGIRFAQLESDSGVGATWIFFNVPCSWQ
ncbi:uncharacterized protein LOC110985695 [Acanthaster planci]|uniref:Uncharacterized protein LOC110985695 n=1 Tax=Acanthaster planci TaxID=133434 RepID=A0A8B7ZAB7_ACAPL|nr:uncharacterized protein LOC110985695 [Acanthaster planci]